MAEDAYTLRHRLGLILRKQRLDAGLTQLGLASATTWSMAKVCRYEKGERAPILADLMLVMPILGFSPQEQADLLDLARRARVKPSFSAFIDILSLGQVAYCEAFRGSATIRESSNIVPLALRTDAYCQAVDAVGGHSPERLLRWQEVNDLFRAPPEIETRSMIFILDESALWRLVGGAEVMHEQLSYLWVLNRRKHLTIRIVPFEAGIFPGLTEGFSLFEPHVGGSTFGVRRGAPDPCYLEREPHRVALMMAAFDQLWPVSVSLESLLPQAFERLAA